MLKIGQGSSQFPPHPIQSRKKKNEKQNQRYRHTQKTQGWDCGISRLETRPKTNG